MQSFVETRTTMKLSISSILLTYAVTYPVLLLTELFGARLPGIVSHANALGFFTVIMIGLIMAKEYGVPRRTLRLPSQTRGGSTPSTLLPVSHVFAGNNSAGAHARAASTPRRTPNGFSGRNPSTPAAHRSGASQKSLSVA